MATSKAYDVENERMNPDGGSGVAGRDIKRRTPLVVSPIDLDVEIPVARSGSHGSNQNGELLTGVKGRYSRNSEVAGGYDSHSTNKPSSKRNP